jgi:lipoprotein-releasing system permease protein
LFGKKSTNAINIITGISVLGISIGSAALILVLSVFNGFQDLLLNLMNTMHADLRVTPVEGKTFPIDSSVMDSIYQIPGVASVSHTLEETALIEYNNNQDFCTLKAVPENYNSTSTIGSAIIEGNFLLRKDGTDYLIIGAGIANRLSINLADPFEAVTVYMPEHQQTGPLGKPFRAKRAFPAATFSIKQDYDYQYVFCGLSFLQGMLDLEGRASAIEIRVTEASARNRVQKEIKQIMGDEFEIRNKLEQDAEIFKLMNVEKWMSYGIVFLTLLIVSFNLIGALWMIVLEKARDISILKSMGAVNALVRRIFLFEGLFITLIGIFSGFVLAVVFYILQKQFGIIAVPQGFVVQSYPMQLHIFDFFVVLLTVGAIGLLASVLPARKAASFPAYIREE